VKAQSTTLGDLLEDYAENVNEFLPWYYDEDNWEGDHGVAGFLGVFGNIASCTFLHGATLGMLGETENDTGCAGDDAAINTTESPKVELGVSTIGIYEPSKVFIIKSHKPTKMSDALYLKRRVFVTESGRLDKLELFRPPSLLWTVYRKPEYMRFKVEMAGSKKEVRSRCISSVLSTFRSAVGMPSYDLVLMHEFLASFYQHHSISPRGFVPQFEYFRGENELFVPSLDFLGSEDFIEETIHSCFRGFARVPNREPIEDGLYLRLYKGMIFETTERNPDLRSLEMLGMVEKRAYPGGFIELLGEQALNAVVDEYLSKRNNSSRRYRFEVVKDIPPWAWDGECVEFFGLPVDSHIEIVSSSFHMSDVLGYEYDVHEYRSHVAKIRKMN